MRPLTDALLCGLLSALQRLVVPALRRPLGILVGCCAVLLWPALSLRKRARSAGVLMSPFCWGRSLAESLCDLLVADTQDLEVEGWSALPAQGGALILSAHLGRWEAGAQLLARRGRDPAVLVADWPRTPRIAARIRRLRERHGVRCFVRSAAGWRQATRHLRSGGTIVVLIDSIGPRRAGRREVSFVGGRVGAPDPLIRWARRQEVPVVVALGSRAGFELVSTDGGLEVEAVSDQAVGLLGGAVRAHPARWAWVRAVACLPMALILSACSKSPELPPVPSDPAAWVAESSGLAWTGTLPGGQVARFDARSATVAWSGDVPSGQFLGVDVHLWTADAMTPIGHIWAKSAQGRWPDGPLTFRLVGWQLAGAAAGSMEELGWTPSGAWSCGGCPLEELVAKAVNPSQRPGRAPSSSSSDAPLPASPSESRLSPEGGR